MRILKVLMLTFFYAVLASPVAALQNKPMITTPLPGAVIQGVVSVVGVTDVPGFTSMELAFTYVSNPTEPWFLIASSNHPVDNAELVSWDTTGITDGSYHLRLRIYLSDGTSQDFLVKDLRVRNYTAVETATATPAPVEATLIPTLAPTSTSFPTPTLLPTNSVSVTSRDVYKSLLYGALTAVVLFSIFGLLARIRKR